MKRIISAVLCAVLILTMFFTAAVSAAADTAVGSLYLSVTEPSLDASPVFSAVAGSSAYRVKTDVDTTGFINGVSWYDDTDHKYLDADDSFEFHHQYMVTVALVCNEGYEFAENVSATINNVNASVEMTETGTGKRRTKIAYIKKTYTSVQRPQVNIQISRIDITGLTDPVQDATPDYAVSDTTANTRLALGYDIENRINGIEWFDLTDQKHMGARDKFVGGHEYRFTVAVESMNGQTFSEGAIGYIDGTSEALGFVDPEENHYTLAVITKTYPAVPKVIANVHVTDVIEPYACKEPAYTATPVEEECEIVTDLNTERWTNGVAWRDEETKEKLKDGDTFTAGRQYTVEVVVGTKGDATFNSIYAGFINGAYCQSIAGTGEYEGKLLLLQRTFFAKYMLGDADGDDLVSIMDATCIQRKLASMDVKVYMEAAADTDRDETVTILDVTEIQKKLAELPTKNDLIGTIISE